MELELCTIADVKKLAELNKMLIEDERSENNMTLLELSERMEVFLTTSYDAYFFKENGEVVGYVLLNYKTKPLYLRQFFIKREYRRKHLGKKAIELLLNELNIKALDLDCLGWNEGGLAFWKSCGFEPRCVSFRLDTTK